MSARQCKGTTRKGQPCKAVPLKDTDHCLAHSDAEVRESVGFIADNGKGGRPRVPRATEVERQLVEQGVIALQRPYWRALGYDVVETDDGPRLVEVGGGGAKLHGTSQRTGEIVVSPHDDLGAQVNVAEKLKDRVFGKPRQATEITGPEGGPIQVGPDLSRLAPEDLRALVELLERASGE